MKKLLATAAIVASVATPALAQSWDPSVGSGNIAPPPYDETTNGANVYQNDASGFRPRAEAARHAIHSHRTGETRSSHG